MQTNDRLRGGNSCNAPLVVTGGRSDDRAPGFVSQSAFGALLVHRRISYTMSDRAMVWLLAEILGFGPTLDKILAVFPVLSWSYLGRRSSVFDGRPPAAMALLAERLRTRSLSRVSRLTRGEPTNREQDMGDLQQADSPVGSVAADADAPNAQDLQLLYRNRFSSSERARKDEIWRVLCAHFFQRYVRSTDTVLDIASGLGEFSRHIKAGRIFAVDVNPDAARFLPNGSTFSLTSAEHLDFLSDNSVDVAFTSNFLEHLPTKIVVAAVLKEVWRVLRPGGIFVALQPNIRFAYKQYWDFFDHHTALSHLSCAEAFELAGLQVIELIDRFLPFSTKSALPTHPLLVRVYLVCRPAWRFFGKQFLIVGRK